MKKVTLEEVQAQQQVAAKLEKRNGNRVELWYSPSTGAFTMLELTGTDYTVNEGDNVRIPTHYNYMDFEAKAERETDLLRRIKKAIARINGVDWKPPRK